MKTLGVNTEVQNSASNRNTQLWVDTSHGRFARRGWRSKARNPEFDFSTRSERPPLNGFTAVTAAERRDEGSSKIGKRLGLRKKKEGEERPRRIAYRADGRRALSSQLKPNYVCARKYLARCTSSFVWTVCVVHVRGDRARGDDNSGSNCCSPRREDMGYDRSTNTHWTTLGFRKRVRHPFVPVRSIVLFGTPFFLPVLLVYFSLRCVLFHAEWHDAKGRSQKFRGSGAPPKGKIRSALACNIFFALCERTGVLYGKEFGTCFSLPRLIIQFQKWIVMEIS